MKKIMILGIALMLGMVVQASAGPVVTANKIADYYFGSGGEFTINVTNALDLQPFLMAMMRAQRTLATLRASNRSA